MESKLFFVKIKLDEETIFSHAVVSETSDLACIKAFFLFDASVICNFLELKDVCFIVLTPTKDTESKTKELILSQIQHIEGEYLNEIYFKGSY